MPTIKETKATMTGRAKQIEDAISKSIGERKKSKKKVDSTKKKYDFSSSGMSIDEMRKAAIAERKKKQKQ